MLSVTVSTSGPTPDVIVSGEIDLATAPELWAGIEEALATGTDRLGLDFTDVSYIDSYGLRILAQLSARVGLQVSGVRPHIRRVFEVVAMTHLLAPAPTGTDATG